MVIDASALVAILCREPGYELIADQIRRASRRLTNGIALFETALAVARIQSVGIDDAVAIVNDFRVRNGIVPVSMGLVEARLALAAHARFGKGRHPARLNLGDCFAYACAKAHGARLLFVGEDFPQTDIAPAL
ncbi:type II toxin-antitoxin system VapC family toxin [Methylobacterium sp. J-067]|uniref:type II toxin-antitoxin system VapC family toxin n=1 Tax=Methylobacterium sp. J-067 TaxID=2836648 RepID=UPI001FB8A176|nr:type II toxin-antitoxin system VapC family toxin [Methylobacterium sp. J-067]MCJ2025062.1 type II toxin-antitoxin system VapC family toxin [Methylobacterium sp. J-067]